MNPLFISWIPNRITSWFLYYTPHAAKCSCLNIWQIESTESITHDGRATNSQMTPDWIHKWILHCVPNHSLWSSKSKIILHIVDNLADQWYMAIQQCDPPDPWLFHDPMQILMIHCDSNCQSWSSWSLNVFMTTCDINCPWWSSWSLVVFPPMWSSKSQSWSMMVLLIHDGLADHCDPHAHWLSNHVTILTILIPNDLADPRWPCWSLEIIMITGDLHDPGWYPCSPCNLENPGLPSWSIVILHAPCDRDGCPADLFVIMPICWWSCRYVCDQADMCVWSCRSLVTCWPPCVVIYRYCVIRPIL